MVRNLKQFVLGLVLSLLVTESYGRALRPEWALPAALLFALSPLAPLGPPAPTMLALFMCFRSTKPKTR